MGQTQLFIKGIWLVLQITSRFRLLRLSVATGRFRQHGNVLPIALVSALLTRFCWAGILERACFPTDSGTSTALVFHHKTLPTCIYLWNGFWDNPIGALLLAIYHPIQLVVDTFLPFSNGETPATDRLHG